MSAKLLKKLIILYSLIFCIQALATDRPIVPLKRWVTKNGTPVFFVQAHELPMIDIQVVFDAGSSRDQDLLGIAKITSDALSSGTVSKNAYQIASVFDNAGARFSSAVNRDMAVVALRSLSDQEFLQPAFAEFSDILTHASFPDSEFPRIQKQTLNTLDEQEELPASIAAKTFFNTLYNGNPYGHPILGTKESIGRLKASDLRNFYKKLYTAQNCLIAMVGDIDESQARLMADSLSSRLNQGPRPNTLEFRPFLPQILLQHVPFPSSQTHVLIGQSGIKRNDPAYFPVMVGNFVLGGGLLTSRLFDEVREKRGLAYSIHSQFSALREPGPFIIELQTRNSEAKNAINVVNQTVDKFVKLGPSEQELNAAKKNLMQGFILKLASNSAIMSQIINIGYYQLPLDYLDNYKKNIAKVTGSEVTQVFQKIIHPHNLVTVTVGNSAVAQNGQAPRS